MTTARYGLGVTSVNGKIYAIGGNNAGYLATNEEYTPPIPCIVPFLYFREFLC